MKVKNMKSMANCLLVIFYSLVWNSVVWAMGEPISGSKITPKEAREKYTQSNLVPKVDEFGGLPDLPKETKAFELMRTKEEKDEQYRTEISKLLEADTSLKTIRKKYDEKWEEFKTNLRQKTGNLNQALMYTKGTKEYQLLKKWEEDLTQKENEVETRIKKHLKDRSALVEEVEKASEGLVEGLERPQELTWKQRWDLTKNQVVLFFQKLIGSKKAIDTAQKIEQIFQDIKDTVGHLESQIKTATIARDIAKDAEMAKKKLKAVIKVTQGKEFNQENKKRLSDALLDFMKVDAEAHDLELKQLHKTAGASEEYKAGIGKTIDALTTITEAMQNVGVSNAEIEGYIDQLEFLSQKDTYVTINEENQNAADYIKRQVKNKILEPKT